MLYTIYVILASVVDDFLFFSHERYTQNYIAKREEMQGFLNIAHIITEQSKKKS